MNLEKLANARKIALSGAGRRIRESNQLSLQEVADTIGVSAPTLARWERGLSRPRAAAALRWAHALETLTTDPTSRTSRTDHTEN
jgi:transcriptional regulator with XRE-family HTH domain